MALICWDLNHFTGCFLKGYHLLLMFLITSNDFILAQMMLLDVTLLLEVFLASMILHSLSGGLLVRLLTAVLVFLALLALEPLVWMLLDVLVGLVARPSLDSSL